MAITNLTAQQAYQNQLMNQLMNQSSSGISQQGNFTTSNSRYGTNGTTWYLQQNTPVQYQIGTNLYNSSCQVIVGKDATIFYAGNPGAEILRITEEGVSYKGQLVQDAGEAHHVLMKTMSEIWGLQL